VPSTVEVLVATYNGQAYLPALLDSLLNRTVSVQILIRDDRSSDQTPSIIDAYKEEYPEQITHISNNGGPTGAAHNFSQLLTASKAPYVLLADQDDVWDLDKIALSLAEMQRKEQEFGSFTPILVHTDLRVVDQDLKLLATSFLGFQGLDPGRQRVADLIGQNVVTGCTAMLNRALCQKAIPVPDTAVMHDWWIALVAASLGKIGFIPRSTVSYRQHNTNTLGAQKKGWGMVSRYGLPMLSRTECAALITPIVMQAEALLNIHGAALLLKDRATCKAISKIRDAGPLERIATAKRFGIQKHGYLKNIAFYWSLIYGNFRK
jgi:glycosyltransferase involved in cell wall biosynthesis